MIEDSSKLLKWQILKVDLIRVRDKLSNELIEQLTEDPYGRLAGYKMVDGNQFGLVLQLENGSTAWFFEDELSEEW